MQNHTSYVYSLFQDSLIFSLKYLLFFFMQIVFCNEVDLIVFSRNRAMQLYAYLESVRRYMPGTNKIFIIYRADSIRHMKAYEQLLKDFSQLPLVCFKQGKQPLTDFKPLTMAALQSSNKPYVLFAVDDIIIVDSIDLKECIYALETTKANGFYLRLGRNICQCYMKNKLTPPPPLAHKFNGILSWQFSHGKEDWGYPCTLDMTLFVKNQVIHDFKQLLFSSPNTLESQWAAQPRKRKMGLCFYRSKIVNIPALLVQTDRPRNRNMHSYTANDLLEKFLLGFKIDIDNLHKVKNIAPHHEHKFTFISRSKP